MALISEVYGSNGHHVFRLYATESEVSTENNTSKVNWNLTIEGQSGWSFSQIWAVLKIKIDGQEVYNVYTNREYNPSQGEVSWAQNSTVIRHNTDGSKTVNISFEYVEDATLYFTPGDASGNGNFTLTKINRYAVTNNVTGSDIEQLFTVNYTKYIDTYKYKLRISVPSIEVIDRIDDYVSGTPFMLSQEKINRLYELFNGRPPYTLGFAVETYNNAGTQLLSSGNEKRITATITGANPIFTDFEFEDINTTTLALTGNNKYIINGYSNIKATISTQNKATPQKEATMSIYRLAIGSKSLDIPYSSNNEVSGTIYGVDNDTIQISAIDSRDNFTSLSKNATQFIQYKPLYLNLNNSYVERTNDGSGDEVKLYYVGTIWNNSFGLENNSITLAKYEYREVDSQTWITPSNPTDITPTINNDGSIIFDYKIRSNESDYKFDLQKSYVFRLTLEDELSSYQITLSPLSSAIPNISINHDGVGIMCDYDETLGGLLQVGGEVYGEDKYSSSEIKTNKIWIDNKPIYRKYITITHTNTGGQDYNHNLGIDTLVSCQALCTVNGQTISSHGFRPMPYIASNTNYFRIDRIKTDMMTTTAGAFTNNVAYIVLEYTKTTN